MTHVVHLTCATSTGSNRNLTLLRWPDSPYGPTTVTRSPSCALTVSHFRLPLPRPCFPFPSLDAPVFFFPLSASSPGTTPVSVLSAIASPDAHMFRAAVSQRAGGGIGLCPMGTSRAKEEKFIAARGGSAVRRSRGRAAVVDRTGVAKKDGGLGERSPVDECVRFFACTSTLSFDLVLHATPIFHTPPFSLVAMMERPAAIFPCPPYVLAMDIFCRASSLTVFVR